MAKPLDDYRDLARTSTDLLELERADFASIVGTSDAEVQVVTVFEFKTPMPAPDAGDRYEAIMWHSLGYVMVDDEIDVGPGLAEALVQADDMGSSRMMNVSEFADSFTESGDDTPAE